MVRVLPRIYAWHLEGLSGPPWAKATAWRKWVLSRPSKAPSGRESPANMPHCQARSPEQASGKGVRGLDQGVSQIRTIYTNVYTTCEAKCVSWQS
jgi:hypothetical protein